MDAASTHHSTDRHREEPTFLGAVLNRTSWGAIIAGAIVAIGLQMLLTVLGIALGATTSASAADATDRNAQTTAALWWLITGTISLLIGGLVVGRFAGMTRSPDVLLHGLTMWGVTALFGFLVLTSGAGMLYGSSMQSAYSSAQTSINVDGARVTAQGVDDVTSGNRGSVGMSDTEEARRAVRTASWWTVLAFLLGIGVSLAGAYFAAPNRIIVKSPSQG